MKKGITICLIVATLLICTMIGTTAAATHVEITTGAQIVGEGVFDSELLMQSNSTDKGLKYYGEAYTPALGVHGPSTIVMSTEYLLTANNQSEIQVFEESENTNIRCKRCFKNYELGTLQAFNTFGDYSVLAEFGGDFNISSMAIEADVRGRGLYEMTVKDPNAPHYYIARDRATFKGDYEIALSNVVERVEEPGADFDDWLGCP